uniref:Ripply transcriptional repressor 2 n=1 Tax=Nothobranchius furzeri TaxID=105023 RepID=A0A8C6M0C3_NOTFU
MENKPSSGPQPGSDGDNPTQELFWPKSRCFDYLYRDAEKLLRNYPFQATICPYEDPSSDEEDEDGDEEEPETKKN